MLNPLPRRLEKDQVISRLLVTFIFESVGWSVMLGTFMMIGMQPWMIYLITELFLLSISFPLALIAPWFTHRSRDYYSHERLSGKSRFAYIISYTLPCVYLEYLVLTLGVAYGVGYYGTFAIFLLGLFFYSAVPFALSESEDTYRYKEYYMLEPEPAKLLVLIIIDAFFLNAVIWAAKSFPLQILGGAGVIMALVTYELLHYNKLQF
jgi:hypothetical protein